MLKGIAKQLLGNPFFLKMLISKRQKMSSHIYYVTVNPKRITHISIFPESSSILSGPQAVCGAFKGYFDFAKVPFEKHFMYRTVQQLIDGEEWKETSYYKKLLKGRGKSIAEEQLKKLERYIKTLLEEGYMSQYELGRADITQKISEWEVPLHETLIGMDRNGKLFRIKGGRHRLAIAQHIGIDEMPAILTLYHRNSVNMLPGKKRKITNGPNDFRPF